MKKNKLLKLLAIYFIALSCGTNTYNKYMMPNHVSDNNSESDQSSARDSFEDNQKDILVNIEPMNKYSFSNRRSFSNKMKSKKGSFSGHGFESNYNISKYNKNNFTIAKMCKPMEIATNYNFAKYTNDPRLNNQIAKQDKVLEENLKEIDETIVQKRLDIRT